MRDEIGAYDFRLTTPEPSNAWLSHDERRALRGAKRFQLQESLGLLEARSSPYLSSKPLLPATRLGFA
jgi:hypothetical protein